MAALQFNDTKEMAALHLKNTQNKLSCQNFSLVKYISYLVPNHLQWNKDIDFDIELFSTILSYFLRY